ncbi:MAG: hypothetical protein ABS35_19670 [Kaistia sp. SCN 65-12]|uniref:hypothetical protein n=1 Tax=Bosea sp. (in: a-proteobacteria) TaxID=1871050 RepID=UPI00086E7841|nr:hypothetical protein [Bosea sp. (in: a-proteobacteria)]MBN9471690.1 hypothetical protein [Bosea sp. (in: a-proteobacteria)]ODT20486.1 MAG: hypothetical protein ABS35_19670 [Kaistia sp. SCN 65-12]
MTAPKVSLAEQIEAVRFAETRQRSLADGRTIKELRARQFAQRDLEALNAAARSLTVLKDDAEQIRAFLKLPAEAREAVLRHGETMGQTCLEAAKREAIAKAGGPVR